MYSYEKMEKLSNDLKDIIHFESNLEYDNRVLKALSDIKANGRDEEKILKDLCRGFAAEYGIAERLKLEINTKEFDINNSESYYYDLYDNESKYEIKTTSMVGTWFFSDNLNTYRTFSSKIDYCILCLVNTNDYENFEIIPKLIINSRTFNSYVQDTNNGRSFYADGLARHDKNCIKI